MSKFIHQKLQDAHDNLNQQLSEVLAPCSEQEIKLGAERFLSEFGMPAPVAYLDIMSVSNGLEASGIRLWGLTHAGDFKESCIFEENEAFGYLPTRELVYFGTTSEGHYYLWDKVRERYLLKEGGFRTDQDLATFDTCEAMLDHLLNAQLRSYGPASLANSPSIPL